MKLSEMSCVNQNAVLVLRYLAENDFGVVSDNEKAIALIRSEASRVLEALSHGNPPDDNVPEFNSAELRLADVVIHCLNMAHRQRWRLPEAIIERMEINKKKP